MEPEEKKTVKLQPDEAYGPRRDELMLTVSKKEIFKDMEVKVGQKFEIPQPDGRTVVVEVDQINDDDVVLNGNHPLAGKELVFDIQLIEIN
jgi:peptidylprolyl isomerase